MPAGRLALTFGLAATVWASSAALPAAEETRTAPERVRATHPRLMRALDDGIERSATLRDLVDRLEKSDIIVHITPQFPSRGLVAGETHFAAATPVARYLRISIQQELEWPRLIAMIAHELQHAVEVAEAPQVKDVASLRALYEAIGFSPELGRHETAQAQDAGARVLRELTAPPTALQTAKDKK